MKNEDYYIGIAKKEIEKKEKWGDYARWTHYNFEKLQKNIEKDTEYIINSLTLKRFFGKYKGDQNYTSHISTKDGLAKYLNYSDWDDFIKKNSGNVKPRIILSIIKKQGFNIVIKSFIGIILLVLSILMANKLLFQPTIEISPENEVNVAPCNVVFDYEIKNTLKKNFVIDFGNSRIAKLTKGQNRNVSFNFGWPGKHEIKILNNGKLIHRFSQIIYSPNWTRSVEYNNKNYYLPLRSDSTGILTITDKELEEMDINPKRYLYYLTYAFYHPFNISLDTIRFTTRVLVEEAIHAPFYCEFLKINLRGEKTSIMFFISDTLCYSKSSVRIGETVLRNDIINNPMLSFNANQWNEFQISTKQNKVYLHKNNTLVFQHEYDEDFGQLFGIEIIQGPKGGVDFVNLYNNDEQIHFNDFTDFH